MWRWGWGGGCPEHAQWSQHLMREVLVPQATRPGDSAPERSDPQEGRKFLMSPRALWQSWTPQASVPRGSVAPP